MCKLNYSDRAGLFGVPATILVPSAVTYVIFLTSTVSVKTNDIP